MNTLAGIAALLDGVDVLVIDQFGTIHDGHAVYPGALAALRLLRDAGKRVALLSNSGKRGEPNAQRLDRLGVPRDLYEVSMTSGEVAWRLLRDGRIAAARGARRCLLLERGAEPSTLGGLGLELVETAAEADLVVIAGSEGEQIDLDAYATQLAPAVRRGVPCLCTNPDRTMLTPGGMAFGAGRIAELYQDLGGAVTWIGKPYPEVYEVTLAALGNPPVARAAAIGDSVEHDIAGAARAGMAGWLVLTGIIAGADAAALEAECARVGARPDIVLERLAP